MTRRRSWLTGHKRYRIIIERIDNENPLRVTRMAHDDILLYERKASIVVCTQAATKAVDHLERAALAREGDDDG